MSETFRHCFQRLLLCEYKLERDNKAYLQSISPSSVKDASNSDQRSSFCRLSRSLLSLFTFGCNFFQSQSVTLLQVGLCLAIYAPRRGVLEVWPVPYGPKLATSDCGYGCRLLQGSVDIKTIVLEGRDLRSRSLATVCLFRPDGRICTLKY